ncbi:ATP-dependent DNA helicase [Actinocrinis sp.]|uniref:ATP-dependent DNA helicase n=1 Tax=Actinocrinis sp. TaxID=1920516 RepID=UPI002D3D35E9|nr:ATP-dependent DNA helicase [Actinocrinis sp.]HZP49795.1 ATP-dependent DNA helicase [Actinocrinis sp.]
MGKADLETLLASAVAAVGGEPRPGQVEMAQAVRRALTEGDPLLVQAGTGTGKSLAYLVPAIAHCLDRRDRRVVVATATLALQRQLVAHDLPLIADALAPALGRVPEFALLKGRSNYVCKHKIDGGDENEGEEALFDASAVSDLGRQILRVREWAEETETGDRDDLVPGVSDRVWGMVSVSARECLTASKCPFGTECFAEEARERAREADIIVTNHALLAINTFDSDVQVLPEHDAVVVDEAHELVSRATGANSGELTGGMVDRAARRIRKHVDEKTHLVFEQAVELFREMLDTADARRYPQLPEDVVEALTALRDASRQVISALVRGREKGGKGASRGGGGEDGAAEAGAGTEGARRQAQSAIEQIFELSDRMLLTSPDDVIWLDRGDRFSSLHIAPLSVAQQLRHRLFARTHTVLTSATLKLGGDFDGVARSVGLYPDERADRLPADSAANGPRSGRAPSRDASDDPSDAASSAADSNAASSNAAPSSAPASKEQSAQDDTQADTQDDTDHPIRWNALDVGSPFDYPKQGILYIARHLAPPGRDGIRPDQFDELAGLIEAAGGRTLGLFSSLRGAQAAAAEISDRLSYTVLCQGEDSLPQLIARFGENPRTCLFGTLSLWQGVNVPGPSCQLVVIDRIPFPRPDDPLAAARQEAVARNGGNGFMAVAATHAALLLAQGAGRLIRAAGDRGVVAILDSRLATARYASFLRASLPPFWPTDDTKLVRAALRRLDAEAP